MKLIIGLGNPGNQYKKTRHNAGFLMLDLLAEKLGISINRKMFSSDYGQGQFANESVVLIKPLTYMNLSGESVRQWLFYYKLSPQDIIVIHDDIDLSPGSVKLRSSGGHGGNNGVRSIIEQTSKNDFFRIKLGVGKPSSVSEMTVTDWVLGRFSEEEFKVLENEMLEETMLRLTEIFRQKQQKNPEGDSCA